MKPGVSNMFLKQSDKVRNGSQYYLAVLKRLMARIRRIRPEYRTGSSWCLLHDNAPSYTSLVRRFLVKNVYVLNHLPYSPDLAPCDYSLFP
ncbi:HTH_48 domain-containing protein [Trichonephila clavipes]|nr:HTH_48 domain-containing protein [Trichonephila clavipes]